MLPNNWFFFLVISILAKIGEKKGRGEFFNEFWLIVRQFEYIYIAEIKLEIYYFQVLSYAN